MFPNLWQIKEKKIENHSPPPNKKKKKMKKIKGKEVYDQEYMISVAV